MVRYVQPIDLGNVLAKSRITSGMAIRAQTSGSSSKVSIGELGDGGAGSTKAYSEWMTNFSRND